MRLNLPVTIIEHEVREGTQLVSKTDLKGKITFVNPEFVAISGFTEKELIGSPHNIVRHPDMPEAAFADLWVTIQRGEPWTGLVKNRCKNGDYYWVEANVTPLREQGQIIGYMSVRTQPTRAQIEATDLTYRMMREGGQHKPSFITQLMSFFRNLSLRGRVITGLILFILANLGLTGILIQEEYNDLMAGHRETTRKVVESAYSIVEHFYQEAQIGHITEAIAQSTALAALRDLRYDGVTGYVWINDFGPRMVMHPMVPELNGKPLSEKTDPDGKHLFLDFVRVVRTSQSGFVDYRWPKPGMNQPVPKVSYVKGFMPWQWVIGSGLYVDDVETIFHQKLFVQGGITVVSLVLLSLFASLILYTLKKSLREAIKYFEAIAEGHFDQKIIVRRRDELGRLLLSLKSMQIKLSVDMSEALRRADSALRVQTALDKVSTNVMISDAEGEVIYLNNALMDMFTRAETNIRTQIPNFTAKTLLGQSIDKLHRYPSRQRQLLENLRLTHRTHLVIGGHHFDLVINPVVNASGKRLGTVVEWNDVTALKRVQDEVENMVRAAQSGELTKRIDLSGKEGFLLGLSEKLNYLLETVAGAVTDVVHVLQALADGDLTSRINNDYGGDFAQIRDHFNTTSQQLLTLVGDIRSSAESVESASREIAVGTQDLSKRTEQQAASLEETGSTMEQITATVKQNAANAGQANQFAISAREVAERGGHLMTDVVQTMEAITKSSTKIADIIAVIDGIAFQTNILALNAAVEAARAGAQGRGFSVVAAEVRSLAQRSAAAAKEIKGLIEASTTQVKNGSRLVGQAGQAMDEIVSAVKRVTDLMGEISAASREQSAGIEQINQAVIQMDESTQQNAALVEEATAAATGLTEQARELREAVEVFRLSSEGLQG